MKESINMNEPLPSLESIQQTRRNLNKQDAEVKSRLDFLGGELASLGQRLEDIDPVAQPELVAELEAKKQSYNVEIQELMAKRSVIASKLDRNTEDYMDVNRLINSESPSNFSN